MSKVFPIIREEFRMTAANRTFILLTILGPFLIVALTILPAILTTVLSTPDQEYKIGLYTQDDKLASVLSEGLKGRKITLWPGEDLETMKDQVISGELEGLLVVPTRYMTEKVISYYSKTGSNLFLAETIQGVLGEIIVSERLTEEGLDPSRIATLTRHPALNTITLDRKGKEQNRNFMDVLLIGLTFVMMIYMTVILYGQSIGRSVLLEKTSKTVEILLSSVSPWAIMFGKIIGKGLASILQYVVWITTAVFMIKIVGPKFALTIPSAVNGTNFTYLFTFFVLAFFLYAAIYAALGAASEDEQHLTQLSWPTLIFLIIPLMMISPIVFNPGSSVAVFFSLFPLTAPLVMLLRVLAATPPLWQLLLCYGLLIATIGTIIILSAMIFRVGILMTGKRFSIKQIISWLWQS